MIKTFFYWKQEHPDLSKADKKRLCRILDCQKLSSEVRAHAVKNERLPLRTVVQVLFFDQEKGSKVTSFTPTAKQLISVEKQATITSDNHGKLKPEIDSSVDKEVRERKTFSESSERDGHRTKRADVKLPLEREMKDDKSELDVKSVKSCRTREISKDNKFLSKSDSKKLVPRGSRSDHGGEQRQVKR